MNSRLFEIQSSKKEREIRTVLIVLEVCVVSVSFQWQILDRK